MLYLGKQNTSFMASTTSYIINFNKKTGDFTLKSTKDEITVDAKHKKYEWLKSQDTGRIVKISDKGRWNSSKDYIGLYDEINSSKSKKKSTVKSSVKTTKRKAKPVKDNSTELKELKTQLKELKTSNNKLKTENAKLKNEVKLLKTESTSLTSLGLLYKTKNTSLRNEIQLLKKKVVSVKTKPKPKPVKKQPKQYEARITATLSATKYDIYGDNGKKFSKILDITIRTEKLDKKPTQSFFKSYCKLVAKKGWSPDQCKDKFGMPIDYVTGFFMYYLSYNSKNIKISNISFISIKEY